MIGVIAISPNYVCSWKSRRSNLCRVADVYKEKGGPAAHIKIYKPLGCSIVDTINITR